RLIRITNDVKGITVYEKYQNLSEEAKNNKTLIDALKALDINANVNWPLMHMGSAYRYLDRENDAVDATGGTNWKEYLPPSFQKVIFFPEIYSKEELNNWGKQWVDHIFNPNKK
ncbi:MAG: tryptophan 2,3-dioxygenase, partial [Sediminicola sp.]